MYDSRLFNIYHKKSMGNLHLKLYGFFAGYAASLVGETLQEHHKGCNRLFIDTRGISQVDPFGIFILHEFMSRFPEIARRGYFKGSKGEVLAVDEQRVLKFRKRAGCGCSGKCNECGCADKTDSLKTAV